jgi:hypothetical protein
MIERNQPCPCGSGKKYKKCHGAAGNAASTPPPAANKPAARDQALAPEGRSPAVAPATGAAAPAPTPGKPADSAEQDPFLIHTGRGVHAERTEAERKKHLRRRIQDTELRGTLVYNSGAFFKPPAK